MLCAGLALLAGCSSDGNVAGNSAETGSPELAGVLYLDNGAPASFARIRVVGSEFDYYHGDDLGDVTEVVADSSGAYSFDSLPSFSKGGFSFEAFHEESGKRLLIQGLSLADADSLVVQDTLQNPGFAQLSVEHVFKTDVEGLKGNATIVGTTYLQNVVVENGLVQVGSLPAGQQSVVIHLFADDTLQVKFEALEIFAGDTVVFDTVPNPVRLSFAAPLKFPEGVNLPDSVAARLTDVPMAFRMDSSVLDFEGIAGLMGENGRFEAYRINANGELSKTLPISIARFDETAREAVFWVRLDSLNQSDSVIVTFNSEKPALYATDVFPTNGSFLTVWHFEEGAQTLTDAAENRLSSDGVPKNVKVVDGVVGRAFEFDGTASVTVESSADGELNFSADTMSFSLWVRLDEVGSAETRTIFSKANQYGFYYDPADGYVVCILEDADTALYAHTYRSGDSLAVAGVWTHIYFQRRGAMEELYVNGNLVPQGETVAETSEKRSESADFVMGQGFKGAIDEVSFGNGFHYGEWVSALFYNQNPTKTWLEFEVR